MERDHNKLKTTTMLIEETVACSFQGEVYGFIYVVHVVILIYLGRK